MKTFFELRESALRRIQLKKNREDITSTVDREQPDKPMSKKTKTSVDEKTLTPAELKKREEVAKAIERENPNMPMGKKMAIATATAKKVAEEVEGLDEISKDTVSSYYRKAHLSHINATNTLDQWPAISREKYNKADNTIRKREKGADMSHAKFHGQAKVNATGVNKPKPKIKGNIGFGPHNEDFDQLDEISRDTTRSYIRKAHADNTARKAEVMKPFSAKDMDKNVSLYKKFKKREAGIELAGKKTYNGFGTPRVKATESVDMGEAVNDVSTFGGRKLASIANSPNHPDRVAAKNEINRRRMHNEEAELGEATVEKWDNVKVNKPGDQYHGHKGVINRSKFGAHTVTFKNGKTSVYDSSELVKEDLDEAKKPKPSNNALVFAKNLEKIKAAIKKESVDEGAITSKQPRGEKPWKPSMSRPNGEWDPIHGKAPRKGTLKYDIWKSKVRQDKGLDDHYKEEVELDEVSTSTLSKYSVKAASQGMKRVPGQWIADQKVRKKEGKSSVAKVAAGNSKDLN